MIKTVKQNMQQWLEDNKIVEIINEKKESGGRWEKKIRFNSEVTW